MGLDTVELVMAFEEKFGIDIPNEDAEKIVTVRDVIDYVFARVAHDPTGRSTCLSQRAFYRLRRAAQAEFGVSRNAVRPQTPLETIVPRENRRMAWLRLKDAAGVTEWPELNRSQNTVLLIAAASVTIAVAAAMVAPSYKVLIAVSAAAFTAMLLTRTTRHARIHFARLDTVGQLADYMVARSTSVLKGNEGWTREQVRATVRAIVTEYLNVEPGFSDDASFVDDLGAD